MDLVLCFINCSPVTRLLLEEQPTKRSSYCSTLSRDHRASLNPKIDRDLSTICLKCLEKDPKRRYSSALALAEDLEHWLKHEPIQAKPSGFFTHGRKWVRRNPSTTVLVTLLVALAVGLSVIVWNRKPAVVIPKSVAVLPFENLSDDPNNAYFAEGIQEEILTRLAKHRRLKSNFAHFHAAISQQAWQSRRDRQAAWRSEHC